MATIETPKQKITPMLWFENQAEEAMNFYLSVFKNSRQLGIMRWGDTGPGVKGSVLTASFEIEGQAFTALNGGPEFKFTEAVSFVVNCDSQEEVDYFWDKLREGGGQESQCGWLKDKFGLSWQVTPVALPKMLSDEDVEKSNRVMQAMLKMRKLDLPTLQKAYDGE